MLICKEFKFDSAHRLLSPYSRKCKNIHGHTYKVQIFFESNELNSSGMIIDFKKIGKLLEKLIDKFDHSLIVCERDPIIKYLETITKRYIILPYEPTCENLSIILFLFIKKMLNEEKESDVSFQNLILYKVKLYETETNFIECLGKLSSITEYNLNEIKFSEELNKY